jgi:hypothetical protein
MKNPEVYSSSELPEEVTQTLSDVETLLNNGDLKKVSPGKTSQEGENKPRKEEIKDVLQSISLCHFVKKEPAETEKAIPGYDLYYGSNEDGEWLIHVRQAYKPNPEINQYTELLCFGTSTISGKPNVTLRVESIDKYNLQNVLVDLYELDKDSKEVLSCNRFNCEMVTDLSHVVKAEESYEQMEKRARASGFNIEYSFYNDPKVQNALHTYFEDMKESERLMEVANTNQDDLVRELYSKEAKKLRNEASDKFMEVMTAKTQEYLAFGPKDHVITKN